MQSLAAREAVGTLSPLAVTTWAPRSCSSDGMMGAAAAAAGAGKKVSSSGARGVQQSAEKNEVHGTCRHIAAAAAMQRPAGFYRDAQRMTVNELRKTLELARVDYRAAVEKRDLIECAVSAGAPPPAPLC